MLKLVYLKKKCLKLYLVKKLLLMWKSNCNNASGLSQSDNSDSKRFDQLPFIIAKLTNEAKSLFYNNDIIFLLVQEGTYIH